MVEQVQRFRPAWQQDRNSKFFAIDWSDVIGRLAVWDQLAPETRKLIAHLKSGMAVDAALLGDDVELLERANIVYVALSRATARLRESALPFVRLLRALERHDLLAHHSNNAFLAYFQDHLTNDERRDLAASVVDWGGEWALARHATSVGWPRGFISGQRAGLDHPGSAAAHKLVAWFLAHPQIIPLRDVPQHLPELTLAELSQGLRLCFERMFLFPMFQRPERIVVVGLWPPIAQRLAEPLPSPPIAFQAERQFEGAYLLDDMTVLLIAASTEPLRIRQNDNALFERTRAALAAQLAPLPEWLGDSDWFSAEARIANARELLEDMKLLGVSRSTLRPKRAAAEWLALDEKARLRAVLDWLRAGLGRPEEDGEDESDELLDDEDDYTAPARHWRTIRLFPPTMALRTTADVQLNLLEHIRDVLAGLDADAFTPIHEFLIYNSRCANPLLTGDGALMRKVRNTLLAQQTTDEMLEEIWVNVLGDFWFERLLPLGCAAIGTLGERTGFRLAGPGRYLLGLARDFEHDATMGRPQGTVIVQPNFDVVFTAPAPRAEAAIGRFAERVGNRIGVLFRITRSSALAAAAAGLTAHQALAALSEISSRPIPDNVRREITGWFAECRRIAVAPALLMRCPDAHTAARVLAAGAKSVRPVSETIVELVDPGARARLIKKLRGLGIFVDEARESVGRRR
jgi:hypothetical protein